MADSKLEDISFDVGKLDLFSGVERAHDNTSEDNDPDSDSIRFLKGTYTNTGTKEKSVSPHHDNGTKATVKSRRRTFSFRSSAASSSRISVATYSTWSTNMTMSNLVGAGRTIGNLYSFAGRRLEKGVLQLLARTGRGPDACADRLLGLCQSFFAGWPFRVLRCSDKATSKRGGALSGEMQDRLLLEAMGPDCERLLRYGAATNLPEIQLTAFRRIFDLVTRCPFMRRAFKACCESRNVFIDLEAVIFSWKKSEWGLDANPYSDEWLISHRLATLSLGTNDVTLVVDKLAYFTWSKDRSETLAALINLCLDKGDLGELAKGFLRCYILDYDVPRALYPIGLCIRFWEDMLEIDQAAHDNLVNIFEQMDFDEEDVNSDVWAGTQDLANVLLRAFRKDIHYHIRYAFKKGDVRAFLTVLRIVKLECIRRGKVNCDVASRDWKTWLALQLDLCKVSFDVSPFDEVLRMAPLSSSPVL